MKKPWSAEIEKYREPASWECKDIPVDIVLTIIDHESRGKPGLQAKAKCKSAVLPSVTGTEWKVDRALGLMQVIPPNIVSWNENPNHERVFIEDMIGNDERAIRLQIRLGCWIYASTIAGLHKNFPSVFTVTSAAQADPNLIRLSFVAYLMGVGGLSEKLEQLQKQGKPLTFEQLRANFPNWGKNKQGKWINRPIHYGETAWNAYAAHAGGEKIATTPPTLGDKIGNAWKGGGWLLIPVAAAFLWAMSGRKKGGEEK
jgi:hypothetical protein